ncbi:ATP-binding protein [Pseudonocardia hydrocarbonoxydans]|uniref:Transcriptional regulator n=1 Tax=Pseudonocardia hydrocarbonoxydans TaxID=76726 RepID=A0A4Y3WTU1_9PSEU|nr:LuxR family transcriptional regulator [Pseudonocardia hydrocarbonoxydans]GEC22305.1 transcriptional regulator [Pseudonocardia hydrocarbonoxydans]
MIVGRDAERATIDGLLAEAMRGTSRALLVTGEAGIGKSALLDHAAAAAGDALVLRALGIESEAELAFGGLHQLLVGHLDRLDALPGPQAAALRAAFGLADGAAPDRFLIGAGTLTLLAELADERPLLCLVDDVQWLDHGSVDALLFAARRFQADPIAVLMAARDTAVPFAAPGIDTLALSGLPVAESAALLDARVPGLSGPVRERVLHEARGNPLAVLELGGAQAPGRHEPVEQVGPLPVAGRVQRAFRAQLAELSPATRTVLLAAAADGRAGLDTVLRVAARRGATPADLAPAERAGLVTVTGGAVAFRHPLVRAAVYQGAAHHEQVAVHRAFADDLAGTADADRRAWHESAAAIEPDERVAEGLERAAERARHRGGVMAVCAAYDRAARLSTDDDRRARRLTLAAQAAWDGGRADRAARLAAEAESYGRDPRVVAAAMFVRAQVEYDRTAPRADADLALPAAELVLTADPERAAEMLTEVLLVGRHVAAHDLVRRAADRLRSLAVPPDSDLGVSIGAQVAWSALFDGRADAAVGPVGALAAGVGSLGFPHRIVAAVGALLVGDDAGATRVLEETLDHARATGAAGWSPYVLEFLAIARLLAGAVHDADAHVTEAIALATEAGWHTELAALRALAVWVAAAAGDEDRATSLARAVLPDADARGLLNADLARWGLARLDLAGGRFDRALRALDAVCTAPGRRDVLVRAVPDHVEAAVRAGDQEAARRHLPEVERWAEQVGGPVAPGLALRCRALLGDDDGVYRAALDAGAGPFDQARTRLVHGEWLRRRRRRSDAHTELSAAAAAFDRLGARRWEQRARSELATIGERPVAHPAAEDPRHRLTPQELQVVRLAATGRSNKEIAAQLFLSPRTVGHHLHRAFPKLGIARRAELSRLAL